MVMRPGVVRSANALCVISIQLGMPCGRQWLRTRKGRPAFSSATMCWICARTAGFPGGAFSVFWRFWSFTSGIHTPLRSGGSARARETADISTSAIAQQMIASFFATIFTLTNRSFLTVRSAPRSKSHMQSALNNLVRRHILVITITKDRLLGGARLHHSARSVFFHRWRDDWIRLLIVAADEFFPGTWPASIA